MLASRLSQRRLLTGRHAPAQGNKCPGLASPNLFAFLQANVAFNALSASIAPPATSAD